MPQRNDDSSFLIVQCVKCPFDKPENILGLLQGCVEFSFVLVYFCVHARQIGRLPPAPGDPGA